MCRPQYEQVIHTCTLSPDEKINFPILTSSRGCERRLVPTLVGLCHSAVDPERVHEFSAEDDAKTALVRRWASLEWI